MKKKTIDALRRSDRAVVGAIILVLGVAVAHIACVPYTDSFGHHSAVADAAPKTEIAYKPAPPEVAMAKLLAERHCLAQAMYYEARGEGSEGEMAVAEVVFHRLRDRAYPGTICGVVFEGEHSKGACQFSFVCNGDMDRAKEARAWHKAQLLAAKIMTGTVPLGDITDHATSYHAVYVDPAWAAHLIETVQIGNHIFYRAPPSRGNSS